MKTLRIVFLLAVVASQLFMLADMHKRHKMMLQQVDFYIRLDAIRKKSDAISAAQKDCYKDVYRRMPNWVKGDWTKHDSADAECGEVSSRALKSAWAAFDAETKRLEEN